MKKRFTLILVLIATIFMFSSCVIEINSATATQWVFDNWTDYPIFVEIENGYPSSLYIPAWEEATTTVYDDSIEYSYDNYFVYDDRIDGENTITFYEY